MQAPWWLSSPTACGIMVPWPGELRTLHGPTRQIRNHWTTREVSLQMIFTEGSEWNWAKGSQGEDYGAGWGADRQYFHKPKRAGGQEYWVGTSTPDSAISFRPRLHFLTKAERGLENLWGLVRFCLWFPGWLLRLGEGRPQWRAAADRERGLSWAWAENGAPRPCSGPFTHLVLGIFILMLWRQD